LSIGANYLAFDIVGDLAFGAPFGMLEAAKDIALVPKNQEDAMKLYGTSKVSEVIEIPAVKILNGRGEYSMSMGVLPAHWRPFVRQLPWYKRGQADVKALAGIAIMAVAKRLATPTDRVDLLSKLQAGRDSEGKPMGSGELTAEALTLLIAGSDTTSKYVTVYYFVLSH
jgi:benzoate 4-monooxygenase